MNLYGLTVFCGGIPVSIAAVKNDRHFYHAISNTIYKNLVGVRFTMNVYDNGVVLQSTTIPETFLGSTLPFVYQNRKLELRVYPETLSYN
jgi:hypothetical protein